MQSGRKNNMLPNASETISVWVFQQKHRQKGLTVKLDNILYQNHISDLKTHELLQCSKKTYGRSIPKIGQYI